MEAIERRILQRRMRKDSRNLSEKFTSVHMGVQSYLSSTDCTVPQLMSCIMEVPHMRVRHLRRMRWSKCVTGIFLELIIHKLISFLQFSVIKHIINTLCVGVDSLHQKMASYEKEYYKYMKTRFFFNNSKAYIPRRRDLDDYYSDDEDEEPAEILVITDDAWRASIPYLRISDIEDVIMQVYDIDNFTVELVSF